MDAPGMRPAAALIGRTFGEFVVREALSSGGFGTVFRAEQPALAREAVIKVLHTRLLHSETVVHRFLREARLASRLDHPYAAHTYAFGAEPDGVLWIAMELVRGTPLDRLLKAQGPIPLERFVPLLERICEVVHTAHEQGIVHRDLKPANVMVLARAGRLLPKLLDFGIAKIDDPADRAITAAAAPPAGPALAETLSDEPPLDGDATMVVPARAATRGTTPVPLSRLTEDGTVIGSPFYMAPEQWRDSAAADARTDLYALGVLCYEALTGHPPFDATTRLELARAHAQAPPPSLGDRFPAGLDAVLARAMAKDPAHRFASALELAAAFRAASGVEGELVPLPRLSDPVRVAVLSSAPRPLAEAVAILDATRHPHQARDALWQVVRVAVRLVGTTALACHSHVGAGTAGTDPELADSLRALRRVGMPDEAWLALARALARPFLELRDAYPVPELVSFLFGDGSEPLDDLVALHAAGEQGGADSEEQVRGLLEIATPLLSRVLEAMQFWRDYPLVLPGDRGAELWMGALPGPRPRVHLASARLPEGRPGLIDGAGAPVVCLWPFVQIHPAAPGAGPAIFFFEGRGRRGARLVALPSSFDREDELLWDAFGGLLGDRRGAPGEPDGDERCPFPGLAAFTADDADDFIGRERETEAAVNHLRHRALLGVIGPSGAGKSSFVQAGLIPALPAGWQAVVARPGPAPLVSLAARLEATGVAVGDLRAELEDHPGALGALLRGHAAARRVTLVLVIDQLEELFTLCDEPAERELYAQALARVARSPDDQVRVVFTLRDDFLVRTEALSAFRARLGTALQIVSTPAEPELLRILREPLGRAGYELDDPALADEMVAAVAGAPGALALLSFTASKLWELRDQRFRQITRKAYASLGGIGGALARHADAAFAAMHAEEQRLVREVFRHAVTAEGTRAVLSRAELVQVLGGGGPAQATVEKLIASRLLVAYDSEAGRERIEIAHEALIAAWPRLLEWRRQDAEGARLRDQLRAAARQWDERRRPAGLLWRGEALAEYRLWRARFPGRLTDGEEAFAAASLADAARARRLRRALIATTISVLAAVVVALLLFNARLSRQRERAETAQADALTSKGASERAAAELGQLVRRQYQSQGRQLVLAGDPLHGLAYLSMARERGAHGPALDFLMADALRASEGEILQVRHDAALVRARFSPDGATLVTCGYDGEARLWDAATGELRVRLRHAAAVRRIDVSRDSRRVLTASSDGTAGLWDAASGRRLRTLDGGGVPVQAALFSPSGDRIVTVGADDSVRLWDAEGRAARLLSRPGQSAGRMIGTPVAFSPDGSALAVGSDGGTLRIWQLPSGRLVTTAQAHRARITAVAFAPGGRRVVTASGDGTAALWEAGGRRIATLHHRGQVFDAAFSPEGRRVVTASADRTAVVWDAERGAALVSLGGHLAGVNAAVFSPDGALIATVSDDATAQLWDAATGRRLGRRLGHRSSINSAAFAPSGERLATSGIEGVAIVWTTEPEQRVRRLGADRARNAWAEFSRRGDRVVAAGDDGRVRVWDAASGRPLVAIDAHRGAAHVARFGGGDRFIASAGDDAAVKIWDAGTGALQATLTGHRGPVNHASWSPDGSRLLSAGSDGEVRIWSPAEPRSLVTLAPGKPVFAAEFTGDGARVVTVAADTQVWDAASGRLLATWPDGDTRFTLDLDGSGRGLSCTSVQTAKVVDIASGETRAELVGHAGDVVSCRFAASGRLVATGSLDGTARIWDPDTGDLLSVIAASGVEVVSVGFSPDGGRLVVGGDDGVSIVELPRLPADFARRIRCRVPYQVVGDRLAPRPRDAGACAPR